MKNLLLILFVAIVAASCSNDGGIEKTYFLNGVIESEVTVLKGEKNGPFTYYLENGNVERTGQFKNDGLDGLIVFYDKNGKDTSRTSLYENGVLTENTDYMGMPEKKVKTDYKNKKTIVYDNNWNVDTILPHE